MKNKIIKILGAVVAMLFSGAVFAVNAASALEIDNATAMAMKEGVIQCYLNNVFYTNVDTGNNFDPNGSSIIAKPSFVMDQKYKTGMLLPNGNATGKDSMNCHDLIFGTGSWEGYLEHYGISVNSTDKTKINTMMTALQYTPSESGEKRCFTLTMDGIWNLGGINVRGDGNIAPQSTKFTSNEVCVAVKDNKIDSNRFENGVSWSSLSNGAQQPGIFIQTADKNSIEIDFQLGSKYGHYGGVIVDFEKGEYFGTFKQSVIDAINERIESNTNSGALVCAAWMITPGVGECAGGFLIGDGQSIFTDRFPSGAEGAAKYTLENATATTTANSAVRAITGSSVVGLTPAQTASLYQKYINMAKQNNELLVACGFDDTTGAASGYTAFTMVESGTRKTCYYKVNGSETAKYVGVQSARLRRFSQTKKKISEIIQQLTEILALPISQTDLATIESIGAYDEVNGYTPGGDTAFDNDGTATCRTAAKSMGWLLCTILDGVGNGVTTLYDRFVEPSLRIEPTLFSNETTGAKQGWDIFQNIANVLIIVLFLVVIFSQLTGVGIDNYGIKKILPKLILVAILMNLSYYICEIAVDISNIVGSGVQTMFDGFQPQLKDSLQNVGIGASDVTSTLASVVLLGGAVGGFWLFGGFSLATLLALIPTAISILVAIFFLFILLAAREAAVVVMVVISPIAFVCFILPNTKKLFDRWLKIGEALLLVYPLAGLLVAGGNYVSRVLLSSNFASDNFAKGLTAMLAGIIPIFFIPSVLRNSMSGLGNIGNRISNLGSRLGRGAAGRVANSEMFKMQQQRANERRALKMAGLRLNKDGKLEDTNGLRSTVAKSRFGKALGLQRSRDTYRQQAASMIAARKNTEQFGNLSVLNAQRTKDENILKDRAAEAEVGVPELTEQLAMQRAQARRSAQELRNYQDQFATYSKDQLNQASQGAFGAGGWLRQQDGAQRMAALIGAMINNGMENDINKLLENDRDGEIGRNASVMQMLSGVKEKNLKAYGKNGAGKSYTSFMEDEVDVLDDEGNPTGRRATLMQQYIDDKGNDFYKDLSDKTLKQLQKHGGLTNSQVMDVLSKASSQDAINVADRILSERLERGESVEITGSQLASLSPTTIATLNQSEVGKQALLTASEDLVRNNRLQTGIDQGSRQIIDKIRADAGQNAIWTAAEKRTQNAPTVEATELDVSAERVQQAQQAVPSGSPEITVNAGGGVSGFEAAYNARTASTQQPVVQQQATVEPVVQQTAQPVVQAAAEQAVVDTSSAGPMPTASADFGPVPVQYQSTGINELFNDATRKSGADLDGVNSAIMNYQGSDFKVTGDQLAGLKLSTVTALTTSNNPTHRQAMLDASDEVANNPALKARLGGPVLARINAFRVSNGRPTL